MNFSKTILVDRSILAASLRDAMASGASRESLIETMRSAGLNQIDCIKMLRDLSGIALGEAKEVVHYSRAWADRRESNEAFHEAAFQAAKELGFSEVSEDPEARI